MAAADEPKPKVLFLCTGNSCRSQMAEGLTRALFGDGIDAFSAGTRPQTVNPLAVKVMAETGIDISAHHSKAIADLGDLRPDYVVTVCDSAAEACPLFPGNARVIHRSFDDPPKLALGAVTEEEALAHYRRVRDEIRRFVEELPSMLNSGAAT